MIGRWGRTEFKQLKQFQKKLEKLSRVEIDEFCEIAAKELAARLLAKVIKRTPVGQYEGGTLRRGWTSNSHKEAESGKAKNAKSYAETMTVKKSGNTYQIEVINPVEYAMFVEYGHRTRNHQGWVPGRFMMTISADEVERAAPKIIERKLLEFLKGAFD